MKRSCRLDAVTDPIEEKARTYVATAFTVEAPEFITSYQAIRDRGLDTYFGEFGRIVIDVLWWYPPIEPSGDDTDDSTRIPADEEEDGDDADEADCGGFARIIRVRSPDDPNLEAYAVVVGAMCAAGQDVTDGFFFVRAPIDAVERFFALPFVLVGPSDVLNICENWPGATAFRDALRRHQQSLRITPLSES